MNSGEKAQACRRDGPGEAAAGTEGEHGRQVLTEALLLSGGHCAGDTAVLSGLVLWDSHFLVFSFFICKAGLSQQP